MEPLMRWCRFRTVQGRHSACYRSLSGHDHRRTQPYDRYHRECDEGEAPDEHAIQGFRRQHSAHAVPAHDPRRMRHVHQRRRMRRSDTGRSPSPQDHPRSTQAQAGIEVSGRRRRRLISLLLNRKSCGIFLF